MSVKKDHTGRRWVEVELEVPGKPDEVWTAIATGPGISSWFVPTEIETSANGTPVKAISHFGPGNSMDSEADITEWAPPHHFKATSADLGPDAPEIATEWIVEARSGSTCTVRVVHSLFTDSDDVWDKQLEGWESGWPWFFQILRLSLLDFRNQPSRAFRIMGATGGDPAQAWAYFTKAIGLKDCAVGSPCRAPGEMPPLIGKVRKTGEGGHEHAALIRLDEPCAGIVSTFAMAMGGSVYLMLDFFLYGKRAEEAAARWEPVWQAWMAERYPMPVAEGDSDQLTDG